MEYRQVEKRNYKYKQQPFFKSEGFLLHDSEVLNSIIVHLIKVSVSS